MAYTLPLRAAFGAIRTGLSTVGYTVYAADGTTVVQARTTTGVSEDARVPGSYVATGTFADAFAGSVIFDLGTTPNRTAPPMSVLPPTAGSGGLSVIY